jgi:N-acetylglucosaminyl-diphospho-decaprenol L-rhamnosyltransferase
MHDLAVIVVSTNDAGWLRPCLSTVFEHAGGATLDVVVVDNESTDETRELVQAEFPEARVVHSENHGFSHANNRGLLTCEARYVLFLNPDTEVVSGTFGDLVAAMDARPEVGLAGVRQMTADGELWPTIRRFPNAGRAIGEALASERWPMHPSWSGERDLDRSGYEREVDCDWTSGSFMLARREALAGAGSLDERFFLYCEETDLCLRIKRHGWQVRHLPHMTIIHHAGKAGIKPRVVAQEAFSRVQYARKNFSPVHRTAYVTAVGLRHAIRALAPGRDREHARARRAAARHALRTIAGRTGPPYAAPPPVAVAADRSNGTGPPD